ncbi:UDP-glucose 4-epimerase GalE [Microbacterium sp. VKM Ac-2870]|uniref:UDP-glucose 4-epimerase GalE n=1 Tax=Microbacterium sp. VKM Ac-2870 TaxID=2783825 RepID=UPI00188D8999|nr:UDP-glucose 4-epimerase GalE [Microbacterium sp. VKM Ac-2870]MBF4562164.1 UDP-glucose 4-epimerase GalE [Microbacterium sp. VKM Ac-2870]
MTWLVTGGAGYIGAHVVRALQAAGIAPIVVDDLSSGHASFVPGSVPFIEGTILHRGLLADTMRAHAVTGVIHVAGFKYAGVSVQRPLHTYEQNVEGTRVVLEAMADADVHNIVFSSSAAVYGTPDVPLVTEDLPKRPASPYGESKLIGEWLLRDQAIATASAAQPLRHTSLRYFNVVGSADPSVYDTSPHNLFPIVFEKLIAGETPQINGDDYDTPDGTNVRDYVHVGDIAAAHVVAAQRLESGESVEAAYNLGSQNGLSVREIMDAMARVTGIDFTPKIGPRRPGDPDRIVATGELAARDLDWANRYTVDEMVRTGWEARRAAH